MKDNTKFALQGKAVEILFVYCHGCKEYTHYDGNEPVVCNIGHRINGPYVKVPSIATLNFICPACKSHSNLSNFTNLGYFVCFSCFYKPKFGEKCTISIIPERKRYNNIPVAWIPNQNRYQPKNILVHGAMNDRYTDAKEVFYPSHTVGQIVLRSLLTGRIDTISAHVWKCDSCDKYNEFEFERKSICICGRSQDTSNYFNRIRFFETIKVHFKIKCNSCKQECYLRDWFVDNALNCPNINCEARRPLVGEEMELNRILDPVQIPGGVECKVQPDKWNIWVFKVQENFIFPAPRKESCVTAAEPMRAEARVEPSVHVETRQILPQVGKKKKSFGERAPFRECYMGYADEFDDEDEDYLPAPVSSSTTTMLDKFLTRRIVALDVECFQGVGQTTGNRAMLVSLYGDKEEKGKGELIIDRRWIKYGPGVQADWPYEQLISNGITRTMYNYYSKSAPLIDTFREELLELCTGKIVLHHGPNDLHSLGITPFLAPENWDITFVDTQNYFKYNFGAGLQPAGLKALVKKFLNLDIQTSSHSPTEDAKALYQLVKTTIIANKSLNIRIDSLPPKTAIDLTFYCLCPFNRECHCRCKLSLEPDIFHCHCNCRCNYNFDGQRKSSMKLSKDLFHKMRKNFATAFA